MNIRTARQEASSLLYCEAVLLDEQQWDEWIDLFADDCEYWVPMWQSEGVLNTDAGRQLSHIYYRSRAGLEDRIERVRSGQSPASSPLPRTTHLLGSITEEGRPDGGQLKVRTSWACHIFFPFTKKDHVFHGRSRYVLVEQSATWKIQRKKIELVNDYIPSMLDFYFI